MKALLPLALLSALIFGCGPSPEPDAAKTDSKPATELGSLVEFKNKDGKLTCPLMNAEIESPEKAHGFVDHDGVRYYICCAMCLGNAKKNPASLKEAAAKL